MDIRELRDRLTQNLETVLEHLLPHGVRQADEYCVGSLHGEAGDSLRVHLKGHKRGIWCDFATGQDRGDIIDLWQGVKGLGLPDTLKQVRAYLNLPEPTRYRKSYKRPEPPTYEPLAPEALRYLTEVRKLSPKTIDRFAVQWDSRHIIFEYFKDGELYLWKKLGIYRKPDGGRFMHVSKDAEPCLFGWQALPENTRWVILTEGELDAMSFAEWDVPALSVPFGGGGGKKQDWIDTEWEALACFDTIYLALDQDTQGFEAVKEIVNRLGIHRCKLLTLPAKDANECLQQGLSRILIWEAIEQASAIPIEWLRDKAGPTQVDLPHNITLEQYVLAWLLNNPESPHSIFTRLEAPDFYWPSHRLIFEAAHSLYKERQAIGLVNVMDRLSLRGVFGTVISRGHLEELRLVVPDQSLETVCDSIRNLATLRHLAISGQEIHTTALSERNVDKAVSCAQQALIRVVERQVTQSSLVALSEVADEFFAQIQANASRPQSIRGIRTGFERLDGIVGGLRPGYMVTLGGRPSMGKTALMLNIVHHVAVTQALPVLMASMEMSRDELLYRLVSIDSGIDCKRLKTGYLAKDDHQKLLDSWARLKTTPLIIDDSAMMTPQRLRLAGEKTRLEQGQLELVVVDYLQLLRSDNLKASAPPYELISDISRELKLTAKHLEVPLLTAAQLSRQLEMRPDKRPLLSDLRDSGSIEQDSDVVWFIYRDEYYTKEKCQEPGICEVNTAKNRDGSVGVTKLVWNNAQLRFTQAAPEKPPTPTLPPF